MSALPTRETLWGWVNTQISQPGGLIARMGNASELATDIPAAFEAYTLLMHLGVNLPVQALTDEVDITVPQIAWRAPQEGQDGCLLLIAHMPPGQFGDIAFWITDQTRSAQLKAMPGTLALPFIVQPQEADQPILFPEWAGAFYPHQDRANCFPLLVFESMLKQGHVPADWVETAIHRLGHYHLPVDTALANLATCRGTL